MYALLKHCSLIPTPSNYTVLNKERKYNAYEKVDIN